MCGLISQAVEIGQRLLDAGALEHVSKEQQFEDKDQYYRFNTEVGYKFPMLSTKLSCKKLQIFHTNGRVTILFVSFCFGLLISSLLPEVKH